MTDFSPLPFVWQGDGFSLVPGAYWQKKADERYVIGERYQLVEHQDRSAASHNHYFAALHEAWTNLPESISFEFPSSEHLRKRGLILTGYRDERSIVCASKAEAMRFAAFIKPMDDFAVVSVHECAVVVWTAKSQSTRAMGRKEFNESKQKVLAYVWELCGVDPETGNKNAGMAA
jgi:hypothetical protein